MTFDLLWEHGTKPGTQTPAFVSRPESVKRRDEGKRQYLSQICDRCWAWSKILKNQSVSFRFEVDGVGVYIKDHDQNLPEGSVVKSESSGHKGFIEQRETGDIVSQRLVSSSQDCTFKKETPPHTPPPRWRGMKSTTSEEKCSERSEIVPKITSTCSKRVEDAAFGCYGSAGAQKHETRFCPIC